MKLYILGIILCLFLMGLKCLGNWCDRQSRENLATVNHVLEGEE